MSRRLALTALLALVAVPVLAQGMPGMQHGTPGQPGQPGQMQTPMQPGPARQMPMQGMPMQPGQTPMAQPASPAAAQAPSTQAFMQAREKMMRDMAIAYTGNTDRDFAMSMIPHHEGAVAMARIQLQHGRDPAMRKLAEDIIAAQEREIAQLHAFLGHAPR